jgi:hypothetical protein
MLDHTDVYCISHFENVLILIVSSSQKRSTHLQNYDRLHILDGKAPCNIHDGKHLFPELKTHDLKSVCCTGGKKNILGANFSPSSSESAHIQGVCHSQHSWIYHIVKYPAKPCKLLTLSLVANSKKLVINKARTNLQIYSKGSCTANDI